MTVGFEGFVWPATEDIPENQLSTWNGEPVILFTDRTDRIKPPPPPPNRLRQATTSGRTALLARRQAVAEWVRRTGAPTGRHALERYETGPGDSGGDHAQRPARPAAALAATAYVPFALPPGFPYRGRRRAETPADWRWPVVVGSVAGATLAMAVLLAASATQGQHKTSDTPLGDAPLALGGGTLSIAPPPCAGGKHATPDWAQSCGKSSRPRPTGQTYHLAAARTTVTRTSAKHAAAPVVPVAPVAPAPAPLPYTPTPFGPPPFPGFAPAATAPAPAAPATWGGWSGFGGYGGPCSFGGWRA